MKAVRIDEFGPFEEAAIGEMPDPVPGEGELVVDVACADVNFPDILYVEGKYQDLPPRPFAPGIGASGTVSALGPGVSDFAVGDRVTVIPSTGCYAEKVKAKTSACYPMPDGVAFDTAAALSVCYQTAWFALTDRGQLVEGEHVLVYGATGGIGMAAVQIAKALGAASVIAVVRGEEAADFARTIGADHVLDASLAGDAKAFSKAVMELTDGHGADVVIDPVGEPLTGVTPRAMAWCGRLVIVGFASGEIPNIRAGYLLVRNISAGGIQWTDYRDRQPERVAEAQRQIFALTQAGKLDPQISDRYPLADFRRALARFGEGGLRGKQVLMVGSQ